MSKSQHSNQGVTIKPVDGGWVSFVDPRQYPKAHFGDTKPYYAPIKSESLIGPSSGMIKLPLHLYWGPERWFNLGHRASLRNVYQMVLEEGEVEDLGRYLNNEVLEAIWDDLFLPTRVSALWETKVIGFRNG
jgi:hypothetical protein